ncbi:MAG: FABP family protein [Acidimicrobiales bacterium]
MNGVEFPYAERVTLRGDGRPFFRFDQTTTDESSERKLHEEVMYLRILSAEPQIEAVVAQPTGIVEVLTGTWHRDESTDLVMELDSVSVTSTPTAIPVQRTRRRMVLRSDEMESWTWLDLTGELVPHLHSLLHRVVSEQQR